ncbi:hypothetical protein Tco_1133996 [Tanacetum coccineum]
MNQNFNYSNSFGFDQIQPPQQFDNHQPQEIPEVIPFFDSETKNELYKMMEDFTERMNQELRKQEVLLAAQREQELLAQKQAAQEKQVPSPNSVFRQLIEETCGMNVCEKEKQNMEDTMLELLEICRQKELYCIHNNVDDLFESALNSKLLSINSQHLDKEKQEVKNIAEPTAKHQTRISPCLKNFKVIHKENIIPLNKTPQISPSLLTFQRIIPLSFLILFSILMKILPLVMTRSFLEEDVRGIFKIYSNPLFEFDDDFTSSDVNPLFNEVLEDVESEDSFDSKLAEPTLLISHLSDANKDECFDPGGDEIDAFLDLDISTEIENDFHDSEGDIIFLEKLLINNTFPNLPSEVFLEHDPRSLKDEPNFVDMVQVFDPGIHEKSFSLTFVKLTFEDHHYLPITFVIRIFLPYLTYSVDSSFLLSSGSEDAIFDPGISTFHFSSLKPVSYESPMEIYSFTCFVPKITMIWGESS